MEVIDKTDYILENENLGFVEKSKAIFSKLGNNEQEFTNPMVNASDEQEYNIDTFKMYSSFIKEKDGLIKVINEICEYSTNPKTERNELIKTNDNLTDYKNRTIMIFSSYQEQPGLLDPILSSIIPKMTNSSLVIIDKLLKVNSDDPIYKEYFGYLLNISQIIYVICKVRGFNPIAKYFSSEVSIFETIANFLIKQPFDTAYRFHVNYVLVLWLSILSMVPFDIDTIDTKGNLMINLINYLKEELTRSTNLRNISSYSISKFLTRPDLIKKKYLDNYINDCCSKLCNKEKNKNIFEVLGIMQSLFEIFKNGNSKDLEPYTDIILKQVLITKFPDQINNSGIFRRSMTKLVQRVGLIMLKTRPQTWRYHLTIRTILQKNEETESDSKTNQEDQTEEDALDYEIDFSKLETIIDFLINNLNDKEYIVRWSAAKGIGRICERLTKEMVEEIFHNLFDLFKDEENEYAWHGACLTIAELCKRGMILPDRLNELIPYLERALVYETNKGTFCTGSIVRDSACYIVWALARSFTTDIMKQYIERLSPTLILTILFDKEVNCRRAASAAFQENVGRQGNFKHGIEILTEADYFTLGIRSNCYLNISIFIAQYDVYYKSIVDYLSFNRLIHIEKNIRELSADTLALLVPFNPNYFVNEIIPKLIKNSMDMNLNTRHGSLIGIGHILLGLRGKWDFYKRSSINRKRMLNGLSAKDKKIMADSDYRKAFDAVYNEIKYKDNTSFLTKELITQLINLVENIDKAKLYRGKGNEVMRSAINIYIKLISETKLDITPEVYMYYIDILIDNIRQKKNEIEEEACESFKILNEKYSKEFENNEEVNKKLNKLFTDMLNQSVNDTDIHVTKGYTSALVYFSDVYLSKNYDNLLKNLTINSKIKTTNNNDPFTRKSAIESLCYLAIKSIQNNTNEDNLNKIMEAIFEGFDDYEMDPKLGDVGSNIRMSCIKGTLDIMLELLINKKNELFNKYIIISLKKIFHQLAEKMPSVRKIAGNELQGFFYKLNNLENDEKINFESIIPDYKELKNIFLTDIDFDDYDNIFTLKWVEAEFSYPKIMPLLNLDEYSNDFFEGLIRSIACISDDIQKSSSEEFKKLVEKNENKPKLIKKCFDVIINIFTSKAKNDKFIEPLECCLGYLLSMNMFINSEYIEYIDKIHKFVKNENVESNNIHKVLYSVDIFYNMLYFEKEDKYNLMNKCLRSLLFLMCHKYPVVRKKASEKLFIFLSTIDDPSIFGLDEEKLEDANLIVAETDWTQKVASIRDSRNNLAEILKISLK